MNTSLLLAAPLLAGALVAGTAVPAFADTGASTRSASTPSASTHHAASLSDIQKKGADATAKRITALNSAIAKVAAAQDLTADHRNTLTTTLQNDLAGMTTLAAKIAGDTEVAQARADLRDVYTEYRVFAVAIPQARITAQADRLTVTVVPRLKEAAAKLAPRVSGNADAQEKLADLNTQIADLSSDASGLAAAALAVTPASYDADHAAMTTVRAQAKSAQAAVKQARADLQAIRADLRGK